MPTEKSLVARVFSLQRQVIYLIKDLKNRVRNLHMFSTSGIIAFQTKKSNLERDLCKETDIK